MQSRKPSNRRASPLALHRYALATAMATFLLLIAGGLVTSTDSGLAVPDWPLSYGTLFPPMVGGIVYEHTHRVIAGIVGILIAVLAGWLWFKEPRRWVRRLGYTALGAVLLQAILGGLTVLLVLPPPVSVAHACLAQVVLSLVVSVAVVTSSGWQTGKAIVVSDRALRSCCLIMTLLLLVQLCLGAIVRHSGHAVAWHIGNAMLLTLAIGWLLWRVLREPILRASVIGHIILGMAAGIVAQLSLGMLMLRVGNHVLIATSHVALGALLLASSCILTLLVFRVQPTQEHRQLLGNSSRSHLPLRAYRLLLSRLADYAALMKLRLTALAVLSTGVGFWVGASRSLDVRLLLCTLLGAGLVGGGGNALNQWAERDADAMMARTKSRPLPTGRLQPVEAFVVGCVSSAAGVFLLSVSVNGLAAGLALLTLISYVGIYTPLKRKTSLCTLVGAVPGALPPLIGWAAARGRLDVEAWVLFAILFLWQLPHFLAIAWLHRDDYARAGFRMLPVIEPDGASTVRQMVLYGWALLVASLLPTILGVTGPIYFAGAIAVGGWFLTTMIPVVRGRSLASAHRAFLASVAYLSIVLMLMVVDKTA